MEFVSVPRSALASRWRPVSHAAPAHRPVALAAPAELGQINPIAATDVVLDSLMATGTAIVGFAMAMFGPKDSPNWRWIGGLVGTVGTMRALNNVTKLGF